MDFKDITCRITIIDILKNVGIEASRSRIACPIHKGDNPTAFSFDDSTFFCFVCGVSGGLIDLVVALHSCTRQMAFKILAKMAGLAQRDDATPKGHSLQHTKYITNSNPKFIELNSEENRLEAIDTQRDCYLLALRTFQRSLKQGTILLSDYYAGEQYFLYTLEELDIKYIEQRHKYNKLRKAYDRIKHNRS